MKLEMEIGKMLMVGIGGCELTAAERAIFRNYQFGGYILFGRNCREPAQIQSLCCSLRETDNRHPPFIAMDQEGGRVHRLPPPFSHFPAAAVIGQTGNPDLAYKAGRATAADLALLGVNLDFAPVLDVHSNSKNPIIGDRSFGTTPKQVIEMTLAWSRGLRSGGIIPCGKHFPGHGDTDKDSHLDLPVVEKSVRQLQAVELPPFHHAGSDRIEALMTAHVLFRALDRRFPATLSSKIVTELLRREMDYQGVVFSDDMEMKAITGNFGTEEAALLGVRAGIDVLLYCHDLSQAIGVFDLLCREVKRDKELQARVVESCERISKLKRRYLKRNQGMPDAKLDTLNSLSHGKLIDEIHGSLYAL